MKVHVKGRWEVWCHNPDGSLAWKDSFPNGLTNVGLNDILDVYFAAGTQKTNWYIFPIDNSGFSALAAGDTMSSHSGWTESTAYSESTRPAWAPGAAASLSMTNSTLRALTINASATLYGLGLVSNSTKGGTTGTLAATGAFTAPQVMVSGQVLSAQYTITLEATN